MDNSKNNQAMNQNVVISAHVINTLRALPASERANIANALVDEFILGDREVCLEPLEQMIYAIIRGYIDVDSSRYNSSALIK